MTRPSNLAHPTDDVLELHSLGRLPEPEAEIVEEHLLACEQCQDRLVAADEFNIATRTAAQELVTAPVPEAWWKRFFSIPIPMPALAAVACAVLAVAIYLPRRNAQETVLDMYAMRGQETAAQAPANSKLTLRLQLDGVSTEGNLRSELADAGGSVVSQSNVELTGNVAVAHFANLKSGTYWVRLYSGDKLLREYALTVR